MKKVLLFLILPLFLISYIFSYKTAKAASPSPSPAPAMQEVNSFDLFWPMVSGKTKDNNLYFLKILKEKIRGFFIFSSALKSDYHVFLSVKRLLEVEALLKENKEDIANQTAEEVSKNIDSALTNAEKSKKEDFSSVSGQMNDRLTKMKTLIDWLMTKYPNSKSGLSTINGKIASLESKI